VQPPQRALQLRHLLRRGALLGREHRRGAGGTQQRGAHVGERHQRQPLELGLDPLQLDPRQLRQRAAAGREPVALRVHEARAQRLQRPHAAVGGGAAAEADPQLLAPALQRRGDQLPGAAGGGAQRLQLRREEAAEAGGRRHLDHRALALHREAGGQVSPQRVLRVALHHLRPGGVREHLHRPRPAVRDGEQVHLHAREPRGEALADGGRRLRSGERSLQLLRRDQDPHRAPSSQSRIGFGPTAAASGSASIARACSRAASAAVASSGWRPPDARSQK
jgi:hypothetical protein